MSSFIDARCQKCKAKVSWVGEMKDHPACGKCGFKPSLESLAGDAAEMEKFKELLRKKKLAKEAVDTKIAEMEANDPTGLLVEERLKQEMLDG